MPCKILVPTPRHYLIDKVMRGVTACTDGVSTKGPGAGSACSVFVFPAFTCRHSHRVMSCESTCSRKIERVRWMLSHLKKILSLQSVLTQQLRNPPALLDAGPACLPVVGPCNSSTCVCHLRVWVVAKLCGSRGLSRALGSLSSLWDGAFWLLAPLSLGDL